MRIPSVTQASVGSREIDLTGLHRRYVNPGELEALAALVGSVTPRTVVEIGVNEGRTAAALMRNIPTIERYIGIDVPPTYVPSMLVQRREVPPKPAHMALNDPRFRLLMARRGTLDMAASDLPACDAVFIDGDHGRAGVTHDTALAKRIVRPGGIIIWHDYHAQETVEVRAVLDEMHEAGAPLSHVDGTWLVFLRV